jgi:4-amino-4-deoxy-L-arabinose transferase-like glycosyltransferase
MKPPLLVWDTALTVRMFSLVGWGTDPIAIRLPALLMGAVGCCVVFLWSLKGRSLAAGSLGAGLLLLDPLWGLLSRLCYTDTLVASLSALALWMAAMDPSLEHRRTRLLFGLFAGAAVMD